MSNNPVSQLQAQLAVDRRGLSRTQPPAMATTYVESDDPVESEDDELLEDEEHEPDLGTLADYLGEQAAAFWERIRPRPLG